MALCMGPSRTAGGVSSSIGLFARVGFPECVRLIHRWAGLDEVKMGPSGSPSAVIDPAFKRVVMYLFVGTKGGLNRMKIMRLLHEEPMNANKICERLKLDYKTVQHHLRLLEENKMIVTSSPKGTYGAMYFLAAYIERNIAFLDDIWVRFGKR